MSNGADVNLGDNEGVCPLTIASSDAVLTKLLLDYGARVDSVDKDGVSALYASCSSGYFETVRCLVAFGADVSLANTVDGSTPLWIASSQGHSEIVNFLLEHGADANESNFKGVTAMYISSQVIIFCFARNTITFSCFS